MTDIHRRSVMADLGAAASSPFTPGRQASGTQVPVLPYPSAVDLVQALAARQISARELSDATIVRIEALDPKINAVVARNCNRARRCRCCGCRSCAW